MTTARCDMTTTAARREQLAELDRLSAQLPVLVRRMEAIWREVERSRASHRTTTNPRPAKPPVRAGRETARRPGGPPVPAGAPHNEEHRTTT